MKAADIFVGGVFECIVSGKLAPVEIIAERLRVPVRLYARNSVAPSHGVKFVTKFEGRNLATGRVLPKLITAARCRRLIRRIQDESR